MYRKLKQITSEEFSKADMNASKTVFNKHGMLIHSKDSLFLRDKDGEFWEVEEERKPLGVLFNRYWR